MPSEGGRPGCYTTDCSTDRRLALRARRTPGRPEKSRSAVPMNLDGKDRWEVKPKSGGRAAKARRSVLVGVAS